MRLNFAHTFVVFVCTIAIGVYATCDPLETTTCSADTALATSIEVDFTDGKSSYFTAQTDNGEYTYNSSGLCLSIEARYDYPTVKSDFYIMYGKIEAVVKAASGTGIVSSVILQSDDGDEIDIEWLGGDTTQVQSNFFSKGNTSSYDRGAYHTVESPQTEYHTYSIDWAIDKTVWYIDGTAVRTLYNTSSDGYPQSPQYVEIGIWAGGDSSNSEGTIEWAGGSTDYDDVPFTMYIQSITVEDYSTGSEYKYTDTSGDWTSIEAVDGTINGRVDSADDDITTVSADSSSSSTKESSSSTVKSSATTESSATAKSSSATTKSSVTKSSSSEVTTSLESSSALTTASAIISSSKAESATTTGTTTAVQNYDISSGSSSSSSLSSSVTAEISSGGAEILRVEISGLELFVSLFTFMVGLLFI